LSVVATQTWVDSDPLLLERILFNLVSNAVRYTERSGAVLGVRRRGGFLAIEICDSGTGISATEREPIFDEFYQIDATKGVMANKAWAWVWRSFAASPRCPRAKLSSSHQADRPEKKKRLDERRWRNRPSSG
jgi:light-regulated signal transduction histidine kinase (bacteriophytochrome)